MNKCREIINRRVVRYIKRRRGVYIVLNKGNVLGWIEKAGDWIAWTNDNKVVKYGNHTRRMAALELLQKHYRER